MRMTRPSASRALTAAAALALGLAPATAVILDSTGPGMLRPAAAVEVPAFPGGSLTLSTTYDTASVSWSGSEAAQSITGGQYCELTSSGPELVRLGGTVGDGRTGLAGFREGSLGVYEQTNAAQCFRVDANSFTDAETLELALGAALVDSAGRALAADSATLDLEMRTKDVRVVAKAWQGPTQVGTYRLLTGAEAPPTPAAGDTTSRARTGENVRWTLDPTAAFDRLTLTAEVGSFSLEGGGDSDAAGPTTVALLGYGDDFFCGDGDNSLTEDGVEVRYLGNYNGTPCEGFGVRLEGTDREVSFKYPSGLDSTAEFLFDIPWQVPNSGSAPGTSVPGWEILFDNIQGATTFHTMPFCPDSLYTDGTLTGAGTPQAQAELAGLDMEPGAPGTQFACVGKPREVSITDATVSGTDLVYLTGDAKMRL